jgi:hypothetical protein
VLATGAPRHPQLAGGRGERVPDGAVAHLQLGAVRDHRWIGPVRARRFGLDLLDRPAHQSVLVGDSVTDIQVSLATGIRSIGFAKTPIRGRKLQAAGADAVTDSVATLADLIRRSDRA